MSLSGYGNSFVLHAKPPQVLLGDHSHGNLARDICEPEVSPLITVGEPFMIDAGKVQHGRVEIVNMHFLVVLHIAITQFIGSAPTKAAFDAATREPDGKRIDVMIATGPVP